MSVQVYSWSCLAQDYTVTSINLMLDPDAFLLNRKPYEAKILHTDNILPPFLTAVNVPTSRHAERNVSSPSPVYEFA